jgi:hypothetical protein
LAHWACAKLTSLPAAPRHRGLFRPKGAKFTAKAARFCYITLVATRFPTSPSAVHPSNLPTIAPLRLAPPNMRLANTHARSDFPSRIFLATSSSAMTWNIEMSARAWLALSVFFCATGSTPLASSSRAARLTRRASARPTAGQAPRGKKLLFSRLPMTIGKLSNAYRRPASPKAASRCHR